MYHILDYFYHLTHTDIHFIYKRHTLTKNWQTSMDNKFLINYDFILNEFCV